MKILSKKYAKRNPGRICYKLFLKSLGSVLWREEGFSSLLPIDVVIVVAEKDKKLLPLVIKSIQRFVRHPIGEYYIISPRSVCIEPLSGFPRINRLYDEDILCRPSSYFSYVYDGIDRSGWLKQQFIKLLGDSFCKSEHYLVVDSDTIFIRPHCFHHKGRYIMHVTQSYHQPYYDLFYQLLGYGQISSLSFISHHMLFRKTYVREMKHDIHVHTGLEWDAAVMKYMSRNTISPFSEYEIYGNYLFNKYRGHLLRLFYRGCNTRRPAQLPELEELQHTYGRRAKSVSFHSYM